MTESGVSTPLHEHRDLGEGDRQQEKDGTYAPPRASIARKGLGPLWIEEGGGGSAELSDIYISETARASKE